MSKKPPAKPVSPERAALIRERAAEEAKALAAAKALAQGSRFRGSSVRLMVGTGRKVMAHFPSEALYDEYLTTDDADRRAEILKQAIGS